MTRMNRQSDMHNYLLRDANGDKVTYAGKYYGFDLSRRDVGKWWLDTCLNATSLANGDGCFCDASQRTDAFMKFQPSLPHSKLDAWSEGFT